MRLGLGGGDLSCLGLRLRLRQPRRVIGRRRRRCRARAQPRPHPLAVLLQHARRRHEHEDAAERAVVLGAPQRPCELLVLLLLALAEQQPHILRHVLLGRGCSSADSPNKLGTHGEPLRRGALQRAQALLDDLLVLGVPPGRRAGESSAKLVEQRASYAQHFLCPCEGNVLAVLDGHQPSDEGRLLLGRHGGLEQQQRFDRYDSRRLGRRQLGLDVVEQLELLLERGARLGKLDLSSIPRQVSQLVCERTEHRRRVSLGIWLGAR